MTIPNIPPIEKRKSYLEWSNDWHKKLVADGNKYYGHKSIKVERFIYHV